MTQSQRLLARITSMRLQPESMDVAFEHFRNVSAPLVHGQPGSLGILGAGDRESGFCFALSLWTSREDLERSNANPAVVEAMGGYAQWMASPFKVESYSVVSGALPGALESQGVWLRTTSAVTLLDRLDVAISTFQARLIQAQAASPACVATLLLAPHIGHRLLAIEFWISRAALASWDSHAKIEDQRLWRSGSVDEPPIRETLEYFGHY